jgi:hypothetical protein
MTETYQAEHRIKIIRYGVFIEVQIAIFTKPGAYCIPSPHGFLKEWRAVHAKGLTKTTRSELCRAYNMHAKPLAAHVARRCVCRQPIRVQRRQCGLACCHDFINYRQI